MSEFGSIQMGGALATTLFLEELKSENIQTRVNAIRSLPSISKTLGYEKTRTELLPMLNEFLDDDDEVLLALAEELGNFVEFLGGPEHSHFLLAPLERLAAVEETEVRDKASASIIHATKHLPKEHFEQFLVPCIRNLSTGDWFNPRTSSCSLFSVTYPNVSSETQAELRELYCKLCMDNTPMVRRAAASHLKNFVKTVDKEHVKRELVSAVGAMSKDEQDSVRLLTVENCIAIAQVLDYEDRIKYVLPMIQTCITDKSWRVRYMVASNFVALCDSIGPELTSGEFVLHFVKMLRDTEAEVRIAASGKITGFSSKIDIDIFVHNILPCIKELSVDSNQHVRAALASDIIGLGSALGKEATVEYLLDVVLHLLKDEFPEVQLSLISKLDQFTAVVGIEILSPNLMPAIVNLAENRQWRVRLAILEHVPLLARQLDVDFFSEKLSGLYMAWLGDSVFSIREAAATNLKQLTNIFGVEWAQHHIIPYILLLRSNPSYLYRVTALLAFSIMASVLTSEFVNDTILHHVIQMTSDDVPNIRFNAAQTLQRLLPLLDATVIQAKVKPTLEKLLNDSDCDVQYFGKQALDQI